MDKITTTIKREWLRTIADRTKRVGYREIKHYWVKRLSRVKVPFQLSYRGGPSKIGSSRRLNNSSNRQNPCKHWHHNDSVFSANRFVPVRNSAIIWDVITPANAPNDRGLAVFWEFFFDLGLYDLPSVPRLGGEVKTTRFGPLPRGGLATPALVAAPLPSPTPIITTLAHCA